MSLITTQIDNYESIIETIRNNIQWLNEYNSNQTTSKRNLLNKWFLDSIKNYFMEQHAAPLLLSDLNLKSTQQIRELVHSSFETSIPKYMSIIKSYFELILKYNKVNEFKNCLLETMSQGLEDFSNTNKQTNYVVQKTIRKQFVGLLVMTYCDLYNKLELTSFYDLWNVVFPNDKQTKKRLSKYDMLKDNQNLNNKIEVNLKKVKSIDAKSTQSSPFKLNNQPASDSCSIYQSQNQSEQNIEEICSNKNNENNIQEQNNQNIQNNIQTQYCISQQKYNYSEVHIDQQQEQSEDITQQIPKNENSNLFRQESQVILSYQQQQKIQDEPNYESSSLITAQNLKQLEYFNSIQNENQNISEYQQNQIENDQTSSLSVNINTEAELLSSVSRFEDEYSENYFYKYQKEYLQYHNEQANDYSHHFENSSLNQIFPQIPYIKDDQIHQELSEYHLNFNLINDQNMITSIENVDLYTNYYDNKSCINQEEFIDSLINHQQL